MQRISRFATVGMGLGAELAAGLGLVALRPPPSAEPAQHSVVGWALHAPTDVLLVVAARGLGLALTSWLLAATLLSGARRIVPGWRHLRALDFATPPSVRRLLDRTLAVGLGASIVLGSTRAAGATTRNDQPVVRAPAVTAPAPPPAPRSVPTAPVNPAAAPTAAPTVVVRAGDNLWVIAQRAVGSERPSDIAPYWRRVIAANLATLRSHDPNLIYPGERIRLPPTG